MMRKPVIALIAVFMALAAACGTPQPEGAPDGAPVGAGPLSVYVVNYPLQYFAERIGGEQVRVVFPAPPDVDPAYWSPDAEVVAAYQGAELILLNGAGYAKWVGRATLPRARLVDTSAGFAARLIDIEGAVTHGHGPQGAHSHAGHAFTTWLDPTLAVEQARAILDAFVKQRPDHEVGFRNGLEALEADLGALDRQLSGQTAGIAASPLIFSHPVYQYFVRRYGLDAAAVHWEPDEPPDAAAWRELERLREGHPARWMIWEAAPLDDTARRLRGAGMGSVTLAPCGNVPKAGDYLDVMQLAVESLAVIANAP